MKISKYILLIFLFNGFLMKSQSLKNYRWENRIIILVDREDGSKAFQKQYTALLSEESELEDRDLIVFLLKDDLVKFSNGSKLQIDGRGLRKELKIRPVFEGVILIGKDGGVKMREEFHVEPQKIFDLIDSMPMRQSEMKNR